MMADMQESILRFFQEIASPGLDVFAEAVTMLGEETLVIAAASFVYWNVSKKTGFRLAAVFILSSVLNNALKAAFRSPRPFQVLDFVRGKRLETATGYSFPSGHSQGAATFFTAAALLFRTRAAIVTAAVVIPAVGLSRVYLGVHWPADALGGIVLGIASALFFCRFFRMRDAAPEGAAGTARAFATGAAALAAVLLAADTVFLDGAVEMKDLFRITGTAAGFFGGYDLENGRVGFEARRGRPIVKAARYLLGVAGAFALLAGLKAALPDTNLFAFIRYGAVGFWAAFLWPLSGMKAGLFEKDPDQRPSFR